jgi:hypothetical protein
MAAFDLALSCVRDGKDHLLRPDHINQLAIEQNHVFRRTTLTPGNTLRLPAHRVRYERGISHSLFIDSLRITINSQSDLDVR